MNTKIKTWIYHANILMILIMLTNTCKKDEVQPTCMTRTWTSQNGHTEWISVADERCNETCLACNEIATTDIVYNHLGQQISYEQYRWENCGNLLNRPPDVPELISPGDGSMGNVSVTLEWSCSDPDQNLLVYEVYFGKTNPPPLIVSDYELTSLTQNGLDRTATYYWKIVAIDCNNAFTPSSIWSFNASYDVPTLTTDTIKSKTSNSATSGGQVISDGGTSVTAKGVCWSEYPFPTINDDKTIDGSGLGSFTSSLTGLKSSTYYYVRAYATNTTGTGYGDAVSFKTFSTLPDLITSDVSSITQTTAQCGGTIIYEGINPVISRGVCWSTSETPTISDNITTNGSGASSFTSTLTGLTANTIYYVRAYATNNEGTSYGNVIRFPTMGIVGSVTDIDGNVYNTITIGEQEWVTDNLRSTHYADNTPISDGTGLGDSDIEYTSKYYFDYNDDVNNAPVYGHLYTWAAAMKGEGIESAQGVCPAGWHIPSESDWYKLRSYLGTDAGGKMKATTIWTSPNIGANNASGFSAIPGGWRNMFTGEFIAINNAAYYWSSSGGAIGSSNATHFILSFSTASFADGIWRYSFTNNGYSVRCIKD
jgi:uncharacterized protein (TIGR02145 family)